jgi:hypothetical protein
MTFLLIFPILWIAIAAGRTVCSLAKTPQTITPLERTLLSCGIGLGLLSYAVLAIGLIGQLTVQLIGVVLVLLAAAGAGQHAKMARELTSHFSPPYKWTPAGIATFVVALAFAVIALIGCFTPPTLGIGSTGYTEWDSLSYHLADPKIYLRNHKIGFIPWESHSNFAFTAEMWYTVALAFHSVALAKLFHFTCGLGACLTTYAIGRRHFSHGVGVVAALILAGSSPILTESGTAYVDLAATFYTALTLLCLLNGLKENDCRWMMPLSAIIMGFTLSCKALALTSLAMFAGALLIWQIVRQKRSITDATMRAAGWCVVALAVGCPWYVKSFILTGDPVFPFGYKVFHSPYWNTPNSASYSAANYAFGMGHKPVDFVYAPWNLTMYALPGHLSKTYLYLTGSPTLVNSFNDYPTALMALPAIFLAALIALPFLRGSKLIGLLAAYSGLSFVFWFGSTQYIRYLLPVFPVLALLSGWSVVRLVSAKRFSGYALGAVAAASVIFTLVNGLQLAAAELPVATGALSQSAFLSQTDPVGYNAMNFINTSTPQNAKVVFYGEPFGFYCDRDYFWGEAGHSTFVPYSTFHSARDLQNWFIANRVTYILVNPQNFPMNPNATDYTGMVYSLTAGATAPVYNQHGIAIWQVPTNPVGN